MADTERQRQPLFLLVTCGTSALKAEGGAKFSGDHSNDTSLTDPDRARFEELTAKSSARQVLPDGHGAEYDTVNCCLRKYDREGRVHPDDVVLLLASDTVLGAETAKCLVMPDLLRLGFTSDQMELWAPEGLRTDSARSCVDAMDAVLRELVITRLPKYPSHLRVFATVGGFKAMTSFITVLGTAYADRIVYTFDKTNELIEIPRLPLEIDPRAIYAHADALRQIREGVKPDDSALAEIPTAFLNGNCDGLSWLGAEVLRRLDDEVSAVDHVHWPAVEPVDGE